MPPNNKKPVIFLAFANETESQKIGEAPRYLASLQEEKRKIQDTLLKAQKDGNCELKMEAFTRVDDIFEVFQSPDYRDRIAIFHFGGHAGGNELLFEKAGGGNQEANAEGLAKFFGHQKGLELVFLNGCSTREQVEGLFNANIPAVVATEYDIDDLLATRFAVFFYGGLANGLALHKAFDQAKTQIETVRGKQDPELESHRNIGKPNRSSQLPWRLHIKPGSESIRNWSLTKAANNYLFGLPKLEKLGQFPDNPYQRPHGFRTEDAEYFFGRDQEIRELYDLVTDPDSAPLILFYGQAWVGKSSLLAAGLVPRLKANHEILNCRLDEQKNLSEVFREAFKTNETTSFLEAWQAAEEDCGKPVTVIIDQFEEVFKRRSKASKGDIEAFEKKIEKFKDEIENFLKDLLPVFGDISSRPRGKLILSIRKEHEADLRQNLKQHGLGGTYREFFLMRLQEHGVIEAIQGLENTDYLNKHYKLEIIEEGLPKLIAGDLLEDPESTVALTLQILLSEMWRQAKVKQKKEANDHPEFDEKTYLDLKRGCLHLEDFLNEKLKELESWNEEFVKSGLLHDLLFEHVSKLNTASSLTHDRLEEIYSDRLKDIQELVQACKNSGLLVDLRRDETEDSRASRLTHDALAPVVRARFEESDRPGQRARKILENRRGEWDKGRIGTTLDGADLRVVETGKAGMHSWTPDEVRLINASHDEQRNQKRKRIGGIIAAVIFLLGFSVYFVKARNAEIKADEEKARLHAARVVSLAESQAEQNPLLSSLLLLSLNEEQYDEPYHGVRVALEVVQQNIPRDIMKEHTARVRGVACNPHDKQVVTASNDNSALVWNLDAQQAGKPLLLPHEGTVLDAVFNPSGNRIVTWTTGTVRLWSASGSQEPITVGRHSDPKDSIRNASFNDDGKYLLTATKNGLVRVWNMTYKGESSCPQGDEAVGQNADNSYYGKCEAFLDTNNKGVKSASYSPDGKYILATLDGGGFIIWDANNYRELGTSSFHKKSIEIATFSNDDKYLVTVAWGGDKEVLWQLEPLEFISNADLGEPSEDTDLSKILDPPIELLPSHDGQINDVRFAPKSDRFLTVSKDDTGRLWSLDSLPILSFVTLSGHSDDISSGEFSPDGRYIVTGSVDNTVRVWDTSRLGGGGTTLRDSLEFVGHTDSVTDAIFCPDNESIVSASRDNEVRLWDSRGSSEPYLLTRQNSPALDARFSPKGDYIAVAFERNEAEIWEYDGSSNAKKLDLNKEGELGREIVKSIDFVLRSESEDKNKKLKVLTVHEDPNKPDHSEVKEWDASGGRADVLFTHDSAIKRAVYGGPDGFSFVITPRDKKEGYAYNWNRDGEIKQLIAHEGEEVKHAQFNHDGTQVITATGSRAIISSVADEGQPTIHAGDGTDLGIAVFSRDGKEVATGSIDGRFSLFGPKPKTYELQRTGPVTSLEFSPDNEYLLSASENGEAQIWKKDGTGKTVILKVDDRVMNSARFSTDRERERIVTASADGSVRVWRYVWKDLLEYLQSSTRVCLSIKERVDYLNEEDDDACAKHWRCMNPGDNNPDLPEECTRVQ